MLTIKAKAFIKKDFLKEIVRKYKTEGNVSPRVRFAPSPTGLIHLGGLRTALYNFLFAKKHNGKFILRIEDTDQTRCIRDGTKNIIEDLRWTGIQIDEGPNEIGGDYGSYIQSERLELYRKEVKKLLENGTAYYCFCTQNRLDLLRKEALRTRQIPKYDNKCRHLTPLQIAEKLTKNDKFCIRFKLNTHKEITRDLIFGDIVCSASEMEGDPIIIKSDGYPTYHLANVIDDHYMKITHVFRGIEWQTSLTKHLLLYRAFSWNPPQYGHLPLLVNADGSKLSKRQGDMHLKQCRENGIYPLTVINYVTQAGGGFIREQSTKLKLYTINELIQMFDISKINSNSSRLNPDILKDLNRLEIKRRLNNQDECIKLADELLKLVNNKFPESDLNLDQENIINILRCLVDRITNLQDLIEGDFCFLWISPKEKNIQTDLSKEILLELCSALNGIPFQKDNIQSFLSNFTKRKKLKSSNFMRTLRESLSGLNEGPSVAEMMEILGKEISLKRLSNIKAK